MMQQKKYSGLIKLMIISAVLLTAHGDLFAQLTAKLYTALQKSGKELLMLSANPPAGTTAVRFFIDDMQFCELTDLYAKKTATAPVWRTVIDPAWLDKGEHKLRTEADVNGSAQTIETKTITGTKENTAKKMWLTGEWSFAEAGELPAGALEGSSPAAVANGYKAGKWTNIFVPNSLGAVSDKWNKYEGILGLYKRSVDLAFNKTEQLSLLLESCYWSGRVFINGKEVGETHGGYLPSRFDITAVAQQGINEIAVLVDNRFTTMGSLKRINEFYWNWGGLLQEVSIEKHSQVSFTDLRAEGSINGTLKLHLSGINASNIAQKKSLTIEVYDKNNKKILGPVATTVTAPSGVSIIPLKEMKITRPVLWNMDNPYLYTVLIKGDFGELKERTGFREVKVQGSDVVLNGKVLQGLQGFNRHGDYPGLGRTQPDGLVYQELKMLHDKGFRIFRPAHYPTTPAMLDAADELGLLVIEEVNVTGLKGAVMGSKEVIEFGKQQLTKMIHRDRSHPSLIAYSVGNENLTEEEGAADYVREVIGLGKSFDPNRLYTQVTHRHTNDKTFQYQDFVCQNYYAGWYAKDINAIVTLFDAIQSYAGNKPVMLSEYGAEAIPYKTGTAKGGEFYQGFVVDAHNRLLNNRKHFFGKMYWCSTDFWCRPNWTGGSPEPVPPFHYKSLVSIDREHKKLGWRVMFSPVRIILNPHTTKAYDLGGEIALPTDKDSTVTQMITVKEVRGTTAKGKLLIQPPKGFTVSVTEFSFELKPEEGKSFRVTLKGILPAGQSLDCVIRAVIDEDTEAQPVLITMKQKETAK